jgi:SAM-dependent methyltransferase
MRIGDRKDREFDQYASSYAALLDDPLRDCFARDPLHFHRRKWLLLQRLLQKANISIASQRWLDVGCGRGELLEMAGHHFAQAMGCDPSAGMISHSDSFRIAHQPSLSELPFEDASVDFVTAVCVYHHVQGVARTLLSREIRRVLAPGGLCCIIEHNPLNPVTRAIVRRCPVDVDAELLTAQETSALLLLAGFEASTVEYFLYLPEQMFNVVGQVEGMLRKVPLGGQYALLARMITRTEDSPQFPAGSPRSST